MIVSPPAEFVIAVANVDESDGEKSVCTGMTPSIVNSAGYGRIIRRGTDNDIEIAGPAGAMRSVNVRNRDLSMLPSF